MALATIAVYRRCFCRAFWQEASTAIRRPVFHWLAWCFPLLLFALIGSNFSEGTLQHLPVSVVDNDQSHLSRQLIRQLNAGSHADIVAYRGGLEQASARLRSAQDYALLYIPKKFEADVLAGRQPTVTLFYNALFYGAGLYSTMDFSGLMADLNNQYRSIVLQSIAKTVPSLTQIGLNYSSMFNASGSFVYYQQFAATVHLVQLFVVTCIIYVMVRSKALVYSRSFTASLLGKLSFYTLCYSTLLMVQLAILVWIFDAKVTGNPFYMLLVSFFYVMAAQSLGILLYTFNRSAMMAYTFMGILVSVALTFSGIVIPELSMPWFARLVADIEPLTHALYAMFDIFLRDVTGWPIIVVCVQLAIYPLLTAWLVRRRLYQRLFVVESGL